KCADPQQHEKTEKLNPQTRIQASFAHSTSPLSGPYEYAVICPSHCKTQKKIGASAIAIRPGPPICHQISRLNTSEPRRNVIMRYCARTIAEVKTPLKIQCTSHRPRAKSGRSPCIIPASTP